MSEDKGFLFNVVSNIGNGHQVQVAFNLPTGAKQVEMDSVLDEYFRSIARAEARLRVPTIEQQVLQQVALIDGTQKAVDRLRDAPQLNGKRRSNEEAQFQQAQTQLEAEIAKLDLLKRSLELTYKEAEVESSCRIQVAS